MDKNMNQMTKDEALRLALETLEDIFGKNKVDVPAITAIKQALEQHEEEPVAWVHLKPWLEDGDWPDDCFSHISRSGWTPLYISPVNSQPLTDEDIFALENSVPDAVVSDRDWCIYFARAIEAKLKEKNT